MAKITHAFIDADPIAYAGAFICEKTEYYWVRRDEEGGIIARSENYKSTKEASDFFNFMDMQDDFCREDWEREKEVVILSKDEAKKACDTVINDYVKTAKKLSKNPDIKLRGFLTPTGEDKIKDIEGLENRYQGNRDPNAKPKLLGFCRKYIQDQCSWIEMCAPGFEADTHVVALSEKMGERGVILSIDKDLKQCENTHYIDMNVNASIRTIEFATEVGRLYEFFDPRGKKTIKGDGFKWLCHQAIVGDPADGYKGLDGVGQVKSYDTMKDLETKEECMQAVLNIYETKLKKGMVSKEFKQLADVIPPIPGTIQYRSWDGAYNKLSPKEIMSQHFFLAYQERGPKDEFNIEEYL